MVIPYKFYNEIAFFKQNAKMKNFMLPNELKEELLRIWQKEFNSKKLVIRSSLRENFLVSVGI